MSRGEEEPNPTTRKGCPMATMTQTTALSIAAKAFETCEMPSPEVCADVCAVLTHMVAKRAETAAKAAERPRGTSKTAMRNAALVSEVVVPFVNGSPEPVTAKAVSNGCGHPEILTSQKAAVLLKLAHQQGAIQRFEHPKGVSRYAALDFDHVAWVAAKQAAKQG